MTKGKDMTKGEHMSTQPEALRLAKELDAYHTAARHKQAAAELRRLHAANQALREALAEQPAQRKPPCIACGAEIGHAENCARVRWGIEKPEQEPVAIEHCIWARNGNTPCPHTTPPQRTWVDLTDEEIESIFNNWPTYHLDHEDFARVIEAKLKEKNT